MPSTTHTWMLSILVDSVYMTYTFYCMKHNVNELVSSCFEYVSNNANSIFGNKLAYFREKYRIQHDFSNLNKAIKQIEQLYVMSGEEKYVSNHSYIISNNESFCTNVGNIISKKNILNVDTRLNRSL